MRIRNCGRSANRTDFAAWKAEEIRRVIERWTKAVSEGDHDSALGRLSSTWAR